MFIAFMSLHILLMKCSRILFYVEVFHSLKLNLWKREFKVNPTNASNPARVKG
jgi:hypothetical protein